MIMRCDVADGLKLRIDRVCRRSLRLGCVSDAPGGYDHYDSQESWTQLEIV